MADQNENPGVGAASTSGTSNKVWFITGASRGFGRVWTEAALKRGDKVAATARKLESIEIVSHVPRAFDQPATRSNSNEITELRHDVHSQLPFAMTK